MNVSDLLRPVALVDFFKEWQRSTLDDFEAGRLGERSYPP
jgi:hypothetical protein